MHKTNAHEFLTVFRLQFSSFSFLFLGGGLILINVCTTRVDSVILSLKTSHQQRGSDRNQMVAALEEDVGLRPGVGGKVFSFYFQLRQPGPRQLLLCCRM